eukprot:COSAG06_NODE_9895_length_1794_cov_1.997050_2_plen_382_part_00
MGLRLLRVALAAGMQCAAPRGAQAESVALAWGDAANGGEIPAGAQTALDAAAGVTHLASTDGAFVARTSEGTWIAWGNANWGGSIPAAAQTALDAAGGVTHLASTDYAFVVRTSEGAWIAWGNADYGGSIPASTQTALDAAGGATHLASTYGAFVAITCPVGQYAFNEFDDSSTMCYDDFTCGPGFYSSGSTAQTECIACDAGKYGAPGETTSACTGDCAAGRFSTASDISGPTADDCVACDAGKYGAAGATTSACTGDCAAGRFSTASDISGPTADDCLACAAGRSTEVVGSESANDCIECNALEFSLAGSICASCPDSSVSPPGTTSLDGCVCSDVGEHRYSFNMTDDGGGGGATAQGQCITCPQREFLRTKPVLLVFH